MTGERGKRGTTDPERDTVDAENDPLWLALQAYRFDNPESRLTFSARLARENRWPQRYAEAVIEEYRKFCYLAIRAGHPVTPSDEVDQAWHLHLIYSDAYRDFCTNVLGKPLDHGPTKGGADETTKFQDWYRDTISSYGFYFGPAPPEIWPSPSARFADADRFVRINSDRYWIIPRLRLKTAVGLGIGIIGLFIISAT